jgi:hypothetical protein
MKSPNMITRIIAKKDLQDMLKACRAASLSVEKLDAGYQVHAGEVLVLKAMNGHNGYLTRMADNLFS